MTDDAYSPELGTVTFTDAEAEAIEAALATEDPWSWNPGGDMSDAISRVKRKIIDIHLLRHQHKCCYCRMNLYGGGHFMTDREHILPKSVDRYREYSYSLWNLGASCKRCNMEYKRSRIDFLTEPDQVEFLTTSKGYRFVHPNFDRYADHLSRQAVEQDEGVLVKYTIKNGSFKGRYTYNYFNLRGLEINSFDKAQGIMKRPERGTLALEVQALADTYGQ